VLQSWVARTAVQNSAIRNSCWKIFIHQCLHNFVRWQKDTYSGHTEKSKELPTVRACSSQEERRLDKMPAHMMNGGRWIRGSGKRGSGNRGTIMQGWKSREWNSRHQISGLEKAGVEISGEGKVWKAKVWITYCWLYWLTRTHQEMR